MAKNNLKTIKGQEQLCLTMLLKRSTAVFILTLCKQRPCLSLILAFLPFQESKSSDFKGVSAFTDLRPGVDALVDGFHKMSPDGHAKSLFETLEKVELGERTTRTILNLKWIGPCDFSSLPIHISHRSDPFTGISPFTRRKE